eukprot:12900385-Prorocentrum_lima.AAC.1
MCIRDSFFTCCRDSRWRLKRAACAAPVQRRCRSWHKARSILPYRSASTRYGVHGHADLRTESKVALIDLP